MSAVGKCGVNQKHIGMWEIEVSFALSMVKRGPGAIVLVVMSEAKTWIRQEGKTGGGGEKVGWTKLLNAYGK